MRTEVDLGVFGVRETVHDVEALGKRAENASPAMRRIAQDLMADERERFTSHPWVALRPSTRRRKRREGKDPRLLRVTGTLERALTIWKAPGQRLSVNRTSLTFGLLQRGVAYYGAFHDSGDGVPKRPLIVVTRRHEKRMADRVRDHLMKGVE